jgi:hypothetical protein
MNVSGRGGNERWHARDVRRPREADALTRAELTLCAHRNRPRLFDGRVVVTLYAEDILYLPATCRAPASRSSRAARVLLALARRAAEDRRMANAVAELEERGEAVTARAVA